MIWLLACAAPGTVTVVDGRTGAPIDGVAVVPTGSDGAVCPTHLPPTADGGRVVVAAACTGRRWHLRSGDAGWWVPSPPAATDGAVVTAWRVPTTGGVALLTGTELTPWLTNSAVDVVALGADAQVRYPVELPATLPTLSPPDVLVLDAPGLSLHPLVPGEARTLGSPELPLSFGPWVYLGARVGAAGPPVPVVLPEATAQIVQGEGRMVRYVAAEHLEPGRYAVLAESAARAVLFEVPLRP